MIVGKREMQVSVRAASWVIARIRRKGLESANLQLLQTRTIGLNPVQRQRPCRYRSQLWFKPSPALARSICSENFPAVSGGEIIESLRQGLRDEVRRLKAANVDREFKPPEPFSLQTKSGCMDVILHREYDQEKMSVKCELLLQPQDEGEEDEDVHSDSVMPKAPYALLINLTITITKGGTEALEISCQCHGDEYFINYISYHEDQSKEGQDHAIHEKQLSEALKREFLYFLFLRGFDDELAMFLHHFLEKKRNDDRITNIEKVAAVLAGHVV
ncbi:uncharacterized protein At2g39795, mitochondrial isoform X1 [Physcomitrium patens]|uniref:Mitochondrial glycoprotein n=1 Tax=Physcomitrium patens TaxID=3218 RepID=A0A2K1JY18_PHYPA|nr:uncharacterized protein LOC112287287 isoform X1 [Physcomitrium patens]XP_024385932.1 uncharacterized protein LOC112287287 isoform X1 [Physcomitrium patens]PNR46421.1 hypothetical protein PHYPA_013540 [Physcomitrium patens]|eukprot:XP_024385931.1 uncharacterized protein LOC112287287 isoform X1 [Physcomitrella patens]